MSAMENIRREVRQLISINETIQSDLARGGRLTDDEVAVVRLCAVELLQAIRSESHVIDGDGHSQTRNVQSGDERFSKPVNPMHTESLPGGAEQ